MTTTKKTLLAAALLAALGASTQAHAYLFNPDGVPGGAATKDITAFDWQPSNVLADNGNLAVTNFILNQGDGGSRDTTFKVWAQGQLFGTTGNNITGLCTPGQSTCAGGNYEITYTLGYTERVTAVVIPGLTGGTATAGFTFVNDGTSFLDIFYDTSKDSNNFTGVGFDNGTRILSSQIIPTTGGSFESYPSTGQTFDGTPDGNQYLGITTLQTPPSGGNNVDIKLSTALLTVPGTLYRDANFFTQEIDSLQFNGLSLSPRFTTVNPSQKFDGLAGGGNGAGITPSIGSVNGANYNGTNPDIQLQTDPNMPIIAKVPEPTSLALLGLGLGAIGMVSRRRRLI